MAIIENGQPETVADPTNGAAALLDLSRPYVASVTIEGACPILFHRYGVDAVEAKGKAAKNSAARKTDDVESYVYRAPDGTIGIPGTYLVGSLTDPRNGAAKSVPDPRSPRKSALDLFRAVVVPLTDIASLGATDWEFLDRRRVMVQRQAITRVRPGFLAGWRASFDLLVQAPEYVPPQMLLEVLGTAGRLVGVGDFRPTFGRFNIVGWSVA